LDPVGGNDLLEYFSFV